MRLVDAEITQEVEETSEFSRAPRPARRRVYTSLLVTLSVLIGTVAVIYTIFPNRQDEVLTAVMEAHSKVDAAAMTNPSGLEIRAWSVGLFGEIAPWPEVGDGLVPTSASVLQIFKRPLAVVRYDLAGERVSMAFWRARDAPPRTHRRTEDGLYAVSWRRKRFTCIAVGPAGTKDTWAPRFGAP